MSSHGLEDLFSEEDQHGGIQEHGIKEYLGRTGKGKSFNIFFLIHDIWHYFELYAQNSTIHGIQARKRGQSQSCALVSTARAALARR